MGKPSKAKSREPSIHSRAARRETSPTTLRDDSKPSDQVYVPRVQHEGIQKRKPVAKKLSKNQRLRREKGVERAGIVIDQLVEKREKSIGRGKNVVKRKRDWDETNKQAGVVGGKSKFAALDQQDEDASEDEDEVKAEKTQDEVSRRILMDGAQYEDADETVDEARQVEVKQEAPTEELEDDGIL